MRIVARNYDFAGAVPFNTEDIVGLTPLVSTATVQYVSVLRPPAIVVSNHKIDFI